MLLTLVHACDRLRAGGRMTTRCAGGVASLVRMVAQVIPCIHCERSFKAFLGRLRDEERADLEELLESGRGVFTVWRLHSMVADKLHRQRFEKCISEMGGAPPDVVARMERAGFLEPRKPSLEVVQRRLDIGTDGRISEANVFCILFSLALNSPTTPEQDAYDAAGPGAPACPGRTAMTIAFLARLAGCLEDVVSPALGSGPRLASIANAVRAVHAAVSVHSKAGPAARDAFIKAVAREHVRVVRDGSTAEAVAARFAKALSVRSCAAETCS